MKGPTHEERTLLRCMAAVAAADGRVDDTELEEISAIYEKLTGRPAPMDTLREEVDLAWDGRVDAADFVGGLGREADFETRGLIAVACYRVLSVDGEVTGTEAATFNAIVERLGLAREKVLERLE